MHRLLTVVHTISILLLLALAAVILLYMIYVKSADNVLSAASSVLASSSKTIHVVDANIIDTGKVVFGRLTLYSYSDVFVYDIRLVCNEFESSTWILSPKVINGYKTILFVVLSSGLKPGDTCTVYVTTSHGVAYTITQVESYTTYRIYILAFPSLPVHYVHGWLKLEELKDLLRKLGVAFEVVNDFNKLEEIVKHADAHTVIINLHGEVTPMPPWYFDSNSQLEGDTWVGTPPRWKEWLGAIRDALERGAIWVNVGGLPFYYVASDTLHYYQVAVVECGNGEWTSWTGYHGLLKLLYDVDTCIDRKTLNSKYFTYWPPSLGVIGATAKPSSYAKLTLLLARQLEIDTLDSTEELVINLNDRPILFHSLPRDAQVEHVWYSVEANMGVAYLGVTLRVGSGKLVILSFAASDDRSANELAATAVLILLAELIW